VSTSHRGLHMIGASISEAAMRPNPTRAMHLLAGPTFRELDRKTLIFCERTVSISLNAWYDAFGLYIWL
jgi:hypothetical protein